MGKFISFLHSLDSAHELQKVAIKGTYGYEETEELEESSSLLLEVSKLPSATSYATSMVAVLCHVVEAIKRMTW